MIEIADFLRARYAERRVIADAAANLQDDPENGWGICDTSEYAPSEKRRWISPHIGVLYEAESADHIVANNPAVVLADIDAKLAVVKLHGRLGVASFCVTCDAPSGIPGELHGCPTLRLLALPYREHRDYRSEWTPDA